MGSSRRRAPECSRALCAGKYPGSIIRRVRPDWLPMCLGQHWRPGSVATLDPSNLETPNRETLNPATLLHRLAQQFNLLSHGGCSGETRRGDPLTTRLSSTSRTKTAVGPRSAVAAPSSGHSRRPGDTWTTIVVVLLHRHVAYLDEIAVEFRLRHHFPISRASLIIALIESAAGSNVDLTDAASEEEVAAMLRKVWGGRKRRGRM